jgi:hypothetical protein
MMKFAAALALLAAGLAPSQTLADPGPIKPAATDGEWTGSRFKCEDGGDLTARFATQNARFVAIVDTGTGPHALPIVPWTGGPVRLTWTDGARTLTWSPGVQIMWMEGATHRMCGGGHKH